MDPLSFSEEEKIREKLEPYKRVVGDQVEYRPLNSQKRGNVLCFGLDNCYRGMGWRTEHQQRSRLSLAKGHYTGLDQRGDPDQPMKDGLKIASDRA
jgi:hypothetical protein